MEVMASPSEVQDALKEAGNKLLTAVPPVPELLTLLDKVEQTLALVAQHPDRQMRDALIPIMKAFILPELLKHSDPDVKISVTSCMSEITRITAPDAPYDDEQMKEFFELALAALKKLSLAEGRCYTKAVSILNHLARVRSCLVMLDLELDELIFEMFQLFLNETRAGHPSSVFTDMEAIMIFVIEEIEEISLDLVVPLLTSLRKENQNIVPHSYKMGETVFKRCAEKLKPHLPQGIQFMGVTAKDFSEIVSSVCQDTTDRELSVTVVTARDVSCPAGVSPSLDGLSKSITNNGSVAMKRASPLGDEERSQKKSTSDGNAIGHGNSTSMMPKKRGRKPNSLTKPQGFNQMLSDEGKALQLTGCTTNQENKGGSSKGLVGKELGRSERTKDRSSSPNRSRGESADTSPSQNQTLSDGTRRKRRRLKKKADLMDHASEEEVRRYLRENSGRASRKSDGISKSKGHEEEVAEIPVPGKSYGAELIGRAIKVWWPLDETFYEGAVFSFDPIKGTHKVLYADGDDEDLHLSEERWLLMGRIPSPQKHSCHSQHDQEMNVPPSEASCNVQEMKKVKLEPQTSS